MKKKERKLKWRKKKERKGEKRKEGKDGKKGREGGREEDKKWNKKAFFLLLAFQNHNLEDSYYRKEIDNMNSKLKI